MTDQQLDQAINIARTMGKETGTNFAAWVAQDTFGGRVANPRQCKAAAKAIVEMDDDGDPAFWPDNMPNLSGEWAGDLNEAQLIEDIAWKLKMDASDLFEASDDLTEAWADAMAEGYQWEIVRLANLVLDDNA